MKKAKVKKIMIYGMRCLKKMIYPCEKCEKRKTIYCPDKKCGSWKKWFFEEWKIIRKAAERIKKQNGKKK